ncbi:hypothetical protein BGW37DRAFT_24968 [Umbelopsis sp. PMI_123]|nr:hypothetical protein BGW37DRAFT_24968 [Umbelopsis sp. PMI_123]
MKATMSMVWLFHCLMTLVIIFPSRSAAVPIPEKYVPFVQDDSIVGGPSAAYQHRTQERRASLQKRTSMGAPPENPAYNTGHNEIHDVINLASKDKFIDYTKVEK